jgi:YgiT-type zinc finger domain-containing protein
VGAGLEDKEAGVNCPICKHGDRMPGVATVTLSRGGLTLVVKGVPATVCNNCGEEYVTEEAATQLLSTAEAAVRAGVQLEVRQYAA